MKKKLTTAGFFEGLIRQKFLEVELPDDAPEILKQVVRDAQAELSLPEQLDDSGQRVDVIETESEDVLEAQVVEVL